MKKSLLLASLFAAATALVALPAEAARHTSSLHVASPSAKAKAKGGHAKKHHKAHKKAAK